MSDGQLDSLAGDSRTELTTACRRIIDELASSTAHSAAFEAARELVTQAADLLSESNHGRPYEEAEGSLAHFQGHMFHSPLLGLLNPLAPPIAMSFEGTQVTGEVTFGAAYEGPPGCVHGGFVAAAFDEVLGFAQGMSGRPGMTARLIVHYRTPTPLHRVLHFVGDIDHIDGRKIFAKGELRVADDGRLCAEAEGLFVSMKPETFQRLMQDRSES